MKKGFTLIELLAVIIILAIISLISIPIVLEVIEDARSSADKSSIYLLIDEARNFYAESLLNEEKQEYLDGRTNLFDIIETSQEESKDGVLYVNDLGETAVAVIYNDLCYKKDFDESTLNISDDLSKCQIAPYGVICKRATSRHTEECKQTANYCYAAGYVEGNKGTTIEYGKLGEMGSDMESGDAFDCDVDGDGYFDPENERFYYVSDYYDTETDTFDPLYAVLIYSDATRNDNNGWAIRYDSTNKNINGPISAIANLPKNSTWTNVSLKQTKRKVIGQTKAESTLGGKIVDIFDYSGYAARLLTAQEINKACGTYVGSYQVGQLDNCNFLLENTKFSTPSLMLGYWIETPTDNTSDKAWHVYSYLRNVYSDTTNNTYWGGVRPAIEVAKENIVY